MGNPSDREIQRQIMMEALKRLMKIREAGTIADPTEIYHIEGGENRESHKASFRERSNRRGGIPVENYDVIIAGASFAGLSVASQVRGKALLMDKYDIGTFQISACGAPYDVIKDIGCEDSVLQISDTFSFHVNKKIIDIHLDKPYCTFSFTKFCHILNSKNNADFLKAKIAGVEKRGDLFTVYTSKGDFSSRILIDATGWKASVAEKLSPGYVHRDMLSFGIETEVPYQCKTFHFFYEPDLIQEGAGWIFPCGEFSRIGVVSYTGPRKLMGKLDFLLGRFNQKRQKVHGGFFCYCLKEPVVEGVFVVGCAQGQTLPLTGEGIRKCITYGIRCGEIIQQIVDGELDLREGQNEYSRFALRAKRGYDFLLKVQNGLKIVARIISNRMISKFVERYYRDI
jgi:flavin-dependent dehydrogenase